jgi:hypothetical protein
MKVQKVGVTRRPKPVTPTCVLGSQTDENNEADLCRDVDGRAPHEQSCHKCEQAHRHDLDDDRRRQLPAFILREQDEKHDERGCATPEIRRRG